jgi:DNA-directed RNA polymerase subunit RPC12/RpoP
MFSGPPPSNGKATGNSPGLSQEIKAMQAKLTRGFTDSAAALLAALALGLLLSNLASATLVPPREPVLLLTLRTFFWALAGMALAVALITIFAANLRLKLALVLWLALNLVVYEIGLRSTGAHGAGGYLGSLADTFGLSTRVADVFLKALFLYLLAGSFTLLAWSWFQKSTLKSNSATYKTACAHCGGHIAFSIRNLGQIIPCPHCQQPTTLRKPDFLKMTCFFCKEHIEFPTHALGEKIPCPHCNMDITLKEPA